MLQGTNGFLPKLLVIFDPQTDCDSVNKARKVASIYFYCAETHRCVEYSEPEWKAQLRRHGIYD